MAEHHVFLQLDGDRVAAVGQSSPDDAIAVTDRMIAAGQSVVASSDERLADILPEIYRAMHRASRSS